LNGCFNDTNESGMKSLDLTKWLAAHSDYFHCISPDSNAEEICHDWRWDYN